MKTCTHKNHNLWFPTIPREQPNSEFYKGQGFTCKKCSRKSSLMAGRKKRKLIKEKRFIYQRAPRHGLKNFNTNKFDHLAEIASELFQNFFN